MEKKNKKETPTGTYAYDKKLGKVVKISSDVPGLKKTDSGPDCECPQSDSCGMNGQGCGGAMPGSPCGMGGCGGFPG